MYNSYEREDLWDVVERPPIGLRYVPLTLPPSPPPSLPPFLRPSLTRSLARSLRLAFVEAERSSWHWHNFRERIEASSQHHHVLEDSGHWVHRDNPDRLIELMSPSFYDLHRE